MFVAVIFIAATASIPEGMAQSIGVVTSPTWSYIWYDSLSHDNFRCLVVKDEIIFGGTSFKHLQKSTDLGKTWSQKDTRNGLNIPFGTVDALLVLPSGDLLLGCERGIYKSTDDGESWRRVTPLGFWQGAGAFLVTKSGVVFSDGGGAVNGVSKSTDNGETWIVAADSVLTTASYFVGFIETHSGVMLAVTQSASKAEGILRSTDGGKTWTHSNSGLTETNFVSIASDLNSFPEKIYAMGYLRGVFVSEDDGITWSPIVEIPAGRGETVFRTSQGLFFGFSVTRKEPVYQLLGSVYRPFGFPLGYMVLSGCQYDQSRILFGTHNGLWMVTFPVTGINKDPVPANFRLGQNFPNPFNPTTTIEFSLPNRAYVNLAVYNLLGQEIETLVSEMRETGTHKTTWDATGFPSGIYFYRLNAGTFTETKRMVLVR